MSLAKPRDYQNFREYFHDTIIPRRYSPALHVGLNAFCLTALCVFFISRLENATWTIWWVLPAVLVIGNLTVYLVHKFLLHRNTPFTRTGFKVHTKWHHSFFTNKDYHFNSTRDFYILFFPLQVVLGFTLIASPLIYYGTQLFLSQNHAAIAGFSAALYFILYEVFHFISHLRPENKIFKFPLFKVMWQHHNDHHNTSLMHNKNFNIVFPLFDWICNTYYRPAARTKKLNNGRGSSKIL